MALLQSPNLSLVCALSAEINPSADTANNAKMIIAMFASKRNIDAESALRTNS